MWHKVILDDGGIAYFDDKAYQEFEKGMAEAINSLFKERFKLEEVKFATPTFGTLTVDKVHSEEIPCTPVNSKGIWYATTSLYKPKCERLTMSLLEDWLKKAFGYSGDHPYRQNTNSRKRRKNYKK